MSELNENLSAGDLSELISATMLGNPGKILDSLSTGRVRVSYKVGKETKDAEGTLYVSGDEKLIIDKNGNTIKLPDEGIESINWIMPEDVKLEIDDEHITSKDNETFEFNLYLSGMAPNEEDSRVKTLNGKNAGVFSRVMQELEKYQKCLSDLIENYEIKAEHGEDISNPTKEAIYDLHSGEVRPQEKVSATEDTIEIPKAKIEAALKNSENSETIPQEEAKTALENISNGQETNRLQAVMEKLKSFLLKAKAKIFGNHKKDQDMQK